MDFLVRRNKNRIVKYNGNKTRRFDCDEFLEATLYYFIVPLTEHRPFHTS